jgi:molecular chaperone Hsp33
MLMPKSTDRLTTAFGREAGIRLAFVETSESARALERSHLCGPSAGLALADALSGVALLGMDLTRPEEVVSLRLAVDGPLQGLLVEASFEGSLRGCTTVKILDAFDGRSPIPMDEVLGAYASGTILRSIPGELLEQSSFDTQPATVQAALRTYFNRSRQRPALVLISSDSYDGYIDQARGVLAEKMPDGDPLAFERLRARFEDGSAQEALDSVATLDAWAAEMSVGELRNVAIRPLRFACRCSRERALSTLDTLSMDERRMMAEQDPDITIHCHMCGASYTVPILPGPETEGTR